jgi:hypothetical protein
MIKINFVLVDKLTIYSYRNREQVWSKDNGIYIISPPRKQQV